MTITIVTDDDAQTNIRKSGLSGKVRKSFDSYDDAAKAFEQVSEAAEKHGLPVAAIPRTVTQTVNGQEVEVDVYEGCEAIIATVGARKRNPQTGKMIPGIRGVVMFPAPRLETLLAEMDGNEKVVDWLDKIVEKELSHVAFRPLRVSESDEGFLQAVDKMPTSIDAYVISGRVGVDTDTFDIVWPEMRKYLREVQPALYGLLPTKAEVLKCIRSKSYALATEEALEKASAFTFIASQMIEGCKTFKDSKGNPDPLDPTSLVDFVNGRDELHLQPPQARDFSNLPDFSQMTGGFASDEDDGDDDEEGGDDE